MRIRTPSWSEGFARYKGEALYPNLWDGLIGAYAPSLGPQGLKELFNPAGSRVSSTWSTSAAWTLDRSGWAVQNPGSTNASITTGITTALLNFGAFIRFRRTGAFVAAGRLVDKAYDTGFWLGHNTTADNGNYGGGVKDTVAPYGRYVNLGTSTNVVHSLASTRNGTNHIIIGDGTIGTSGTVTGAALSTTGISILGGAEVFNGLFFECYLWDRALSEGEIYLLDRVFLAPFVFRPRRTRAVQGAAGIAASTVDATLNLGDITLTGEASATLPPDEIEATLTLGDITLVGEGSFSTDALVVSTLNLGDVTLTGEAEFGFVDVASTLNLGNLTLTAVIETTDPRDWPISILPAPLLGRTHKFQPRNALTNMESGRIRKRRMFTNNTEFIEVTWNFTEDQFYEFERYFELVLDNGAISFFLTTYEIDDDPNYIWEVTRELAFMAPPKHAQSDNLFMVDATLEVLGESIISEKIENPTNPSLVSILTPDLEVTYEDFDCREMFHLKAAVESGKAYTVEYAFSKAGPYFPHIYVFASPTWGGQMNIILNNDYKGQYWFRLKRDSDGVIVAKPVNPMASEIPPVEMEIDGTEESLATNGVGLYGMAYNMLNQENRRLQPYSYYIVPRKRLVWFSGGSLDPDTTPNLVSITNESELSGLTIKWSGDNKDPSLTTEMPAYGGEEDNLAIYRPQFGYAIRARAFNEGTGCKSPITLYLVDKAMYYTPYATAICHGNAVSDSCDQPYEADVRLNWERDEMGEFVDPLVTLPFESADSCNNLPEGLIGGLVSAARIGDAISGSLIWKREITSTEINGLVYLGEGDGGEHFIGWNTLWASVSSFGAYTMTLARTEWWNNFPKCFSNSILGLGVEDSQTPGNSDHYHISSGESDNEVITGLNGSASLILESWIAWVPQDNPGATPRNFVREFVHVPFEVNSTPGQDYYSVYIYLTLHNDNIVPQPYFDVPIPNPNPEPGTSEPPEIPYYYDSFETYPELPLVAEQYIPPTAFFGLNGGVGWKVRDDIPGEVQDMWTLLNVDRTDGIETFEYEEGVIPSGTSDFKGGEFWKFIGLEQGPWVFRDPVYAYGIETFESYENVTPFAFQDGSAFTGFWTFLLLGTYGYDTFEDYVVGEVVPDTLAMGLAWTLGWYFNSVLTYGYDTFETYSVGETTSTENDGTEWGGAWSFQSGQLGSDDFESYDEGDFIVQFGNAGEGWNGYWHVQTIA